MKVRVDRDRCAGNGLCEAIAPDFFQIGDDGVLVLFRESVGDDEASAVREAVASCPALALSLEDE